LGLKISTLSEWIAKDMRDKGQRLRLKSFTRRLSTEAEISLSSKTVADILVANDLYQASTRRRRPGYYQKLKQAHLPTEWVN
jgi:hypothetical protein